MDLLKSSILNNNKGDAQDRKKDGNDSLYHECKEEIQVIFHKSMDLLTSSILNNNKGGS